ncbi:MAG: lipid-A-disaccharide synthase, partial [Alphaproteobacteria bacterium]
MMASEAGGGQASPLVFLIAGEPSGDLLGARLMSALRTQTGGAVRFAGIGGERMAAEGLDSLVPIDELAIMGVFEIIPHVLRIIRRIRQTVVTAKVMRPAIVVTIDSPSFSLEVSQRLRGLGVPLVHYVAPSVWAWKPWRAAKMARYVDHLLALLPFEPPYFEKHGLATTFVGHPAVEAESVAADRTKFRRSHGIPDDAPVICVLPGSRRGEVRRLAPVFGAALGRLAARVPGLQALTPTVSTVSAEVSAAAAAWPVPTTVLTEPSENVEAFAACDVALAASGTVAVELAVAGVASVIAYRVLPLTALIARRVLKSPYVSLPNILLGREVQPELLQENCTPDKLARALEALLDDPEARAAQIEALGEVVRKLTPGGASPSQRAAQVVLGLIRTGIDSGKGLEKGTLHKE